jgi:4-amino-4-deoxy-L-arabinose transferase-like glycosyltransferase
MHYTHHGDYSGAYMLAHHIIRYGEFPMTGPDTGLGTYLSSPMNYYVAALILLFKDDIVFFGIVHVIIQSFSILLIYWLTRRLFNNRSAVVATIFFAFAQNAIQQAAFPWEPYIAQFFAILSSLLLTLSYQKKNFRVLVAAIVTFIVAISYHYSAAAMIPLFVVLTFLILRSINATIRKSISTIVIAILTVLITHFPSLWYAQNLVLPIVLDVLTKSATTSPVHTIPRILLHTHVILKSIVLNARYF